MTASPSIEIDYITQSLLKKQLIYHVTILMCFNALR